MFVVAGITGNTGSVVGRTLAAAGRRVRALVRSEAGAEKARAAGYEPFVAPLDDAEKLTRALEGAEGAYLLIPPYFGPGILAHHRGIAKNIADALERAKLPRAVLLSSIAAQRTSGTGPIVSVHELERVTAALPNVTYLRAAYFQENWLSVLPAALSDRVLPSFLPLGKVSSMVATEDIGRVAAEVLLGERPAERVVQLAGPSDLTPEEVAAEFASALGHPVTPVAAPVEQVTPTFVQFGLPEELARLYEELYAAAHRDELDWDASIPVIRGRVRLRDLVSKVHAARG